MVDEFDKEIDRLLEDYERLKEGKTRRSLLFKKPEETFDKIIKKIEDKMEVAILNRKKSISIDIERPFLEKCEFYPSAVGRYYERKGYDVQLFFHYDAYYISEYDTYCINWEKEDQNNRQYV